MANPRQTTPRQNQQNESESPSPELFEQFFEVQKAEIAVRAQELELRRLEITKSHEFSKEGLAGQIADRENERNSKRKGRRDTYYLLGFIILFSLLFMSYALFLNKEQIALEVIKGVILVGGGYLGGKYHQKTKDDKDKDDEEQ